MALFVFLSLVLSSSAAPTASDEHRTTYVSETTLAGQVPEANSPEVSTSAPGDVSTSKKDEAPLELFPTLDKDVPRFIGAGYKTLKFQMNFTREGVECPTAVDWFYGEKGVKARMVTKDVTKCISKADIIDLTENTVYEVKASPYLKEYNGAQPTEKSWFNSTNNQRFTESVTSLTCSSQVPPVEDLLQHSVGQGWLGLSWLPPTSSCLTEFAYNILIDGNNARSQMGSFSTATPWNVQGQVKQCVAWPERHCLLLTDVNSNIVIQVNVSRTVDGVDSKSVTMQANTTRQAPESPVNLRCVRAQSRVLQLRWGCPLRPGGHLAYAHVRVVDKQKNIVHDNSTGVTLRPHYDYTVSGLTPGEHYTVSVNFNTTVGGEGQKAVLEACTPLEDSHENRCNACAPVPESSQGAMQSARANSGAGVEVWVLVFCICISICIGILITVTFYARRRLCSCGWLILTQDDDNCSAGSKSIDRRNDAGLYTAAGPQPSGTPLPRALGDAQAVPATCRPFTAGPRSPGHDYEELPGNAHFAPKPPVVREGGDVYETYTELRGLAVLPAAPASKPAPVYAQVDKKRSLPPPPPRPPPVHRPPLQDSD